MNSMDGNNHYKGSLQFSGWARNGRGPTDWDLTPEAAAYREYAQTQAVLALAFEQRTANLIAYVDKIDDTSAAIPVVKEIKSRLGLEPEPTK